MTEPTKSKELEMDEISDKLDEQLDGIETEEVDVWLAQLVQQLIEEKN